MPALRATPLLKDGTLFVANKAVGGSNLSIDFGLHTAYPPDRTTPMAPPVASWSRPPLSSAWTAKPTSKHSSTRWRRLRGRRSTRPAQWGYRSGKLMQVVVPDFRFSYQSHSLGQDYMTETRNMYVDVFDRNVCINFLYFW
ncbi:hypothetical protein [Novosphingobium sp. 9U]|uniref:hypothetical protein n=1 Tax=Novosphingobium sp. 9U TaxID=2653158 RepID=UPI0012EFA1FB|nr:hypothetical protein [Novosphingobium sp. 9U]VWX49448.1 hypothetical protein NOVOSPHI9U_210043 [Novosphingobium sp. 9U]